MFSWQTFNSTVFVGALTLYGNNIKYNKSYATINKKYAYDVIFSIYLLFHINKFVSRKQMDRLTLLKFV